MSDIGFYGLASFTIFLFICILTGLFLIILTIRQYLLFNGAQPKTVRENGVVIGAFLFPFVASVIGLTALTLFDDMESKKLFDQYIALTIAGIGFLAGIIWLIIGLKRIKKQFS